MNFFQKLFGSKKSNFDKIVAARVTGIDKHPNADRLRVIKLDVGGSVVEPVVCGAFNFGVGDMVALALPGATIPQSIHGADHKPFVLEKATIRGVESQGMLCASYELKLGPLSEKPEIALLKNDIKAGSEFDSNMIK